MAQATTDRVGRTKGSGHTGSRADRQEIRANVLAWAVFFAAYLIVAGIVIVPIDRIWPLGTAPAPLTAYGLDPSH